LRAITLVCAELDSDDPVHARRVAAAMPGMRHIELPLPGEVDPYAALTEMPPTDEPFEDVSIFARLRWWMRAVRELGAGVHLTGDGGDAVLVAPPAYLADLARHAGSSELWRHAAGWARLRHRPVHRLVGAARRLARSTQASTIEHYASALEHDQTGQRHWEDLIGWPPAPACPQWFSRHARSLAATALREISRELGDDVAPGDTASLGALQAHGRAHRLYVELAASHGVALHAPYLDDLVVAACLAVPAAQRTSPWQAKPLLCAAMTGRVPEAALIRTTKGDYSMLAYRGLSRHWRTVADLLTNSRLAGLGLIDEPAIRADIARGAAGLRIPLATLDQVLGAEIWLRAGSASAATVDHRGVHRRERAHA
ncbi:MAG: asparagine synthase-related protein, partial [Pseudonocardiaceae bacterium]